MKIKACFFLVIINFQIIAQSSFTLNSFAGTYMASKPISMGGKCVGISFEKELLNNSFIVLNTNFGWFKYFTPNVNSYPYLKNSDAIRIHNSLIFKKVIFNFKNQSLRLGGGIGIITEIRNLPYEVYTKGQSIPNSSYRSSNQFGLEFPITLDYNMLNYKSITLGLIGGTYIQPDYPILSNYFGVNIGIKVK